MTHKRTRLQRTAARLSKNARRYNDAGNQAASAYHARRLATIMRRLSQHHQQ